MKLIGVIPISRGIAREKLSYFSADDLPIGSVVAVPLRNRNIPAIVISSQDVLEEKSNIKNFDYAIKKISRKKPADIFLPGFIETCQQVAKETASATGAVLYSAIPSAIFENLEKISSPIITSKPKEFSEKFIIQTDDDERYAHYKSVIREEFAKGRSVFLCLPTIQELKKASEILNKGIEAYTFILHSALSKKEIITEWNKIIAEPHCVFVLTTPTFLALPRADLGTLIIDRESARAYKSPHRPFLDARFFAEKLSENMGIRLLFGDTLLRTETLWRFKNGDLHEIYPSKFRSLTTSVQRIIDMRTRIVNDRGDEKKVEYKIISDDLKNLIRENQDSNENLFIFTARRGLHPITVCADCNTIVNCNSCGAPTVLHTGKNNFFLCHKCGERRDAHERCKKCDSWRLNTLGIGSELVEQEIKKVFPETNVIRLDSDTATSHKRACQIAERFLASPGSILVGTEMALPYITEKIQNSAIVSMDSFFSVPDFRINERIINIILKIRSITTRNFVLQTRCPDQKVLDYAIKGNLSDFYRDEIGARRELAYPPFSILIKISLTGTKTAVVAEMEKLQNSLEGYQIDIFPAFIPGLGGKLIMHGLIKVPRDSWPDQKLLEKLRDLPPTYSVDIEPESLL